MRARAVFSFAVILAGISALAVSAQVRRPLEGASAPLPAPVALGDETVRAVEVEKTGTPVLELGSIGRGHVTVSIGASGVPATGSTVHVRLTGCASQERCGRPCTLAFSPAAVDDWQTCRLRVAEPIATARLELGHEGMAPARWFASSPQVTPEGPPAPPPVIILLLDTVRVDRLRTYNPAINLGEHLDRFAADAVVFEQVRSTSSWTRPAVATLFTGLGAHTHGVLGWFDALSDTYRQLPQILRERGYRSFAWSTNANVLPEWGFNTGFDHFVAISPIGFGNLRVKAPASTVFERVLADEYQGDGAPFFHYIHLTDAHRPYQPSRSRQQAFRQDPIWMNTLPDPRRRADSAVLDDYAAYLGEISEMDQQLGAFFGKLAQLGLYERSLILAITDHGEEFYDHGGTDHASTLYDELLRIAVLLKLPGNRMAGTRIDTPVALEDVLPTLLEMLAIPVPGRLDGRPALFRDGRRNPAVRPQFSALRVTGKDIVGMTADGYKLVRDEKQQKTQLFDLRQDPAERVDVSRTQSAVRRRLELALEAHVSGHKALARRAPTAAVSEQMKEQLRALGYNFDAPR